MKQFNYIVLIAITIFAVSSVQAVHYEDKLEEESLVQKDDITDSNFPSQDRKSNYSEIKRKIEEKTEELRREKQRVTGAAVEQKGSGIISFFMGLFR